jgi:hypothetical protein
MRIGACLESVREATGEGGEHRLGVTLAELGTRLIAKRLENHDRQTWVRLPPSPPPHCSCSYPIVLNRQQNNEWGGKAVAVSSAMLPLVTAQSVALRVGSEDGYPAVRPDFLPTAYVVLTRETGFKSEKFDAKAH